MAYGANKEIEKIARTAKKQGWEVSVTGNNHLRFRAPHGAVVFGGLTTCGPGVKKFIRHLQREGLQIN